MYPKSIKNLIESFKYFPGIGEKTAERLAFSVLQMEKEQVKDLSQNIMNVSEKIKKCYGQELEVFLEYNEFENFKYYCKNNKINIVETQYLENIVCKIELEESESNQLKKDFETRKINIKKINDFSKKYITKSK